MKDREMERTVRYMKYRAFENDFKHPLDLFWPGFQVGVIF